jgi:hypothetical protein
LPHAWLQGKGLLCTEAPITVPLTGTRGCVPLLGDVRIELLDSDGTLQPLHAARSGTSYEVVVSQQAGLYRYRLGDTVRVTHFVDATPCLQFEGRRATADLVGEKLTDALAQQALAACPQLAGRFHALIPLPGPAPHYGLAIDRAPPQPAALLQALDRALRTAHHYRLARDLGQLAAPRLLPHPDWSTQLTQYHLRRGVAWGDIKPQALLTMPLDTALGRFIGSLQEVSA